MSEEHKVISGVPQGTILASILFIIMILDIDDTKVSAKIRTYEDKVLLQQDLDKIYKWADENLMEFNEKKFEQMSHGTSTNVVDVVYSTGSGEEIKENKTIKDLGV